MYWSDTYPHEIWTNILVIDGKVIDYKIGNGKKDKFSWRIPFTNELINRFGDIEVISSFELVNNDIEHEKAFENGRNKVINQKDKFGVYVS